MSTTVRLDHPPTLSPADSFTSYALTPHHVLILQGIPSGHVIMRALEQPLIMGRGNSHSATGSVPDLDLTALCARQHGVSRMHCRMERSSEHFVVTDLNSTNGTYLNEIRLQPHQPYPLTEGDVLILGTFHLLIAIGTLPGGAA